MISQEHNLLSRLKAVWRREQARYVAAGLLAFCRWGIPLFLAGMAMDWLTELPAAGRGVILVAWLAISAYKAWHSGWRHAGAFNATQMALRVEEHLGGLESLLVTAVQFRDAGPPSGTSESLSCLTCRRAEEAAVRLRPGEIVRFHELRRPALGVLLLTLLMGMLAFVNGPLLAAGAARLFAPWLSVHYPTLTQLKVVNGDRIVKEGDGVRLRAQVSGIIPRQAKLALRTGTGTSLEHQLAVTNGDCEYTIESVFRAFEYRIMAGDARSPWHSVQVIPSPRMERAEVSLEFPPYTERPTQTVESLTVTVPENTAIQWRLTLDRAVSQANFITAGEQSLPLDVSPDGRVVTVRRVATESRAYNFSWVEREHGFSFASPRYYLQVSPDQPPLVELTSPRSDLYATVGRKLDLALRSTDDYGIGESAIAYRVNKTAEVRISFPVPAHQEAGEQRIDWDYRSALPDLAVGDTVSFAVELADRYPGSNGPHRVRSDTRRVSFLSKEAYLEQVVKQKQRLLSQLKTIYREERAVYDLVRRIEPSDEVFVQTCQLEAVRQDLVRERLGLLAGEMQELVDDLVANNITEETHTAGLVRLRSDIQALADQHVADAASSLRFLAGVSSKTRSAAVPDLAPAVHKVNAAARELALVVLQLGYTDAAEVMARELHATAQTQASLRLKTVMPGTAPSDKPEALSEAQEQLAQWLSRLLAATPRQTESTVKDALVAFKLSRLAKELLGTGVDARMRETVASIHSGGVAKAARLQSEAIQDLLRAEFRLRTGSEYEALNQARETFLSLAQRQKALHAELAALKSEEFSSRRSDIARVQLALQRNLHLLLMPSIPAPQPRLFDLEPPSAPPLNDILATAEETLKRAAAHLETSDREATLTEQQKAENAFNALTEIVRQRLESMTQLERMGSLLDLCGDITIKLGQFYERQLSLIEKTQDAAGDRTDSAPLAEPQLKLLDEIDKFRTEVTERTTELAIPREEMLPIQDCLQQVVALMLEAAPLLKRNEPAQAGARQDAALRVMKRAEGLLAGNAVRISTFVKVFGDDVRALAPGPYVADIEAEQRDLIAGTKKAQTSEFPALVMPQKNLVHAVNAVLASLDAVAHKVEAGTGMLFAKTDMDSAAVALEAKDRSEAVDAQTAVADSMHGLQVRLQAVTPQYNYLLEIARFLHENLPEAVSLRAAQSELREKALAATDDASVRQLVGQQRTLESRAKTLGSLLQKATGQEHFRAATNSMADAIGRLEAGDKSTAVPQMQKAEDAFLADTAELLVLMKHLAVVLDPPPPGKEPVPEVKLLLDVLPVAAQQKELCLQDQKIGPGQTNDLALKQRLFEKQCDDFIQRSQSHPRLVEARQCIAAAAAKIDAAARAEAVASQRQAQVAFRHFIIEYIARYVEPPAIPGPQPPAPDSVDPPTEETPISIFMPGVVSGKLPKSGRLEWEVLGHRERAALNENFARELPLEYRAILKNYYERLTR